VRFLGVDRRVDVEPIEGLSFELVVGELPGRRRDDLVPDVLAKRGDRDDRAPVEIPLEGPVEVVRLPGAQVRVADRQGADRADRRVVFDAELRPWRQRIELRPPEGAGPGRARNQVRPKIEGADH
jgi:hypothetical protein